MELHLCFRTSLPVRSLEWDPLQLAVWSAKQFQCEMALFFWNLPSLGLKSSWNSIWWMLISCSQKSLASQKLYRVSGRTEILCHELHCLTKNMEEAAPKVASKVKDLSLCLSTSTLVNGGNTTCHVSVLQNLRGIFSFEHLAKTPGKHPHGPNSSKKRTSRLFVETTLNFPHN